MVEIASKKIVHWLKEKNVIGDNELEICEYGIALILIILMELLPILVLGFLYNEICGILACVTAFSILRRYAGGFHSKTIWGCFFISETFLIVIILIIHYLTVSKNLLIELWVMCGMLLWLFAPIENDNKELNYKEKNRYRKKALFIWIVESFGAGVCHHHLYKLTVSIILGQCLCAVAICLEVIYSFFRRTIMKKRILGSVITVLAIAAMSVTSMAATNKHIYLAQNQAWTSKYSESRSTNFSYAQAALESVYPTSGVDNFSKIQTRLVNSAGTQISQKAYVVLTEGDGYKNISIKEGYLSLSTIYFQFRGNSNKAAEAVVNYRGYIYS